MPSHPRPQIPSRRTEPPPASARRRWSGRFASLLATLAVFALLPGCAGPRQWWANDWKVGPQYARPAAPVAEDWIDAADVRVHEDSADRGDWWVAFGDPKLDELMTQAYRQNLSLRVAGYRILQARAMRDFTAGSLFPQTQRAYADYANNQRSLQAVNSFVTPTRHFDIWDAGFNLSWELDFWGRFRRAIEAADADLDASIENYDDVLVTLLADAATAYIEMRTYERRLEFAQANAAAQRGSLDVAQARFRAGATSELDVDQAKTNLGQTEALIPQLKTAWRGANNRLCVLLGRPPEDLAGRLGAGPIPDPPTEVVVGIPADLLRRRPDVRRAERELAAQSARIGVTEADFYPQLSLNGDVSLRAAQFNDMFSSGASAFSIGPSARWNILNYGRIRNAVLVQDARFGELAVTYQNVVLEADREVEDALIGFLNSQDRLQSLTGSVAAAQQSNDRVVKMYREGKVDFNRVFNVQSLLAQQQDSLAQAAGEVAANLVATYRALGGGWQIRYLSDGPTWCSGRCPVPRCCPDDYCPKPCPTCPPDAGASRGSCGPPEVRQSCPPGAADRPAAAN